MKGLFCGVVCLLLNLSWTAVFSMEEGQIRNADRDSAERVLFEAHLRRLEGVRLTGLMDPDVFVAYSWDNDEHKGRVRRLCKDLTCAGIPVSKLLFDEWANRPGGPYDIHQFKERLPRSEIVVLVGSAPLKGKYEGRETRPYEAGIVSEEIDLLRNRIVIKGVEGVIPAWFSGRFEDAFPRGIHHVVGQCLDDYPLRFFDLLWDIYRPCFPAPDNPIIETQSKFKMRREKLRVPLAQTEFNRSAGLFPQSLKAYNAFFDRTNGSGLSYLDVIFENLFMNEDEERRFSTLTLCPLSGLGGVGKTTLATEFAHKFHQFYDFIYWMEGGSKEELLRSCIALLEVFGVALPKMEEEENVFYTNVIGLINIHLSQRKKHWLLIIDNIENPGLVSDLAPKGGHILYTSRNSEWLRRLDIDVLRREESVKLLLQLTGLSEAFSDQAGILAEELGNLPLALAQAAAYIKQQRLQTFEQYLGQYRLSQAELLAKKQIQPSLNRREAVVMTTWNTTMQKLSLKAQQLMHYFSYLDGADIPTSLFASSSIKDLPESLTELRNYSMIKQGVDSVSVHRLVQTVMRISEEEEPERLMRDLISLFTAGEDASRGYKNFFFGDVERGTVLKLRALLPHALRLTEYAWSKNIFSDELMDFYVRVASFLNRHSEPRVAESLLLNSKAIAVIQDKPREIFDWIHRNLLNSYVQMGAEGRAKIPELSFIGDPLTNGVVAHSLGDLASAKRFGLEAIAVLQREVTRIGGMGHGEGYTLGTAYRNVGIICLQTKDYAEALPHLNAALVIFDRLFGNKLNEDKAITLFQKARACVGIGDLSAAIDLFEEVLPMFELLYSEGREEMIAFCRKCYGEALNMVGKTPPS